MTKEKLAAMRELNPNLIEITHPGENGVYIVDIDGKGYVGQTGNTLEERNRSGYRWKSDLIEAIESAPDGTFEMKWLHEGLGSVQQADFWEKLEIARQGTLYPKGFNKTTGGRSGYAVVNEHTVAVRQKKADTGEVIREYHSIASASRATGVNPNHICDCAAGRLKTAGGFGWERIND